MLLPSALPCDVLPSRPHLQRAPAYTLSSPPPSPCTPSPFSASIFSTCRSLQSLLGVTALPSSSSSTHPHPQNPSRLRYPTPVSRTSPTKIEKRRLPPPRGVHKRRRNTPGDEDDIHSPDGDQENLRARDDEAYATPKRLRRAPPSIPLGLNRRDFYALQATPLPNSTTTSSCSSSSASAYLRHDTVNNMYSPPLLQGEDPSSSPRRHPSDWDAEDDHALVELVLDKLRLSRREWDECARVLGTDGASLGKRWKVLVGEGEVGLKVRRGMGMGMGMGRRSREPERGDVRAVLWAE
ncbi:hypothetical protein MMC19_006689 [Ptychographa xylographoides]|nr:hypothetical protein [Ptychographa xylographoides]